MHRVYKTVALSALCPSNHLQLGLAVHGRAAVNRHNGARDPLTAGARQPDGSGGNVLRTANTLHGQRPGERVLKGVKGGLHHLGAERAERERVDRDVLAYVASEVAREAGSVSYTLIISPPTPDSLVQRCLGGRVRERREHRHVDAIN